MKKVLRYLILLLLAFFIYNWFAEETEPSFHLPHIVIGNPDPILGYTDVELQDTIALESRKTSELIVYEQDLETRYALVNTSLDIDWFRKSQTIHSFGTAYYTVDLSQVNSSNVVIDPVNMTITVQLPSPKLKTVSIDFDKTEIDDMERNILGWGEIKLNPEQQNEVESIITDQMISEASTPSFLQAAKESATEQIVRLYQSVLGNLNPDAIIQIEYLD